MATVCYENAKKLKLHLDKGKRLLDESVTEDKTICKVRQASRPVNIESFMCKPKQADSQCGLFRLVPSFNKEIADSFEVFPLSYQSLYDVKYETMTLEELVTVGE